MNSDQLFKAYCRAVGELELYWLNGSSNEFYCHRFNTVHGVVNAFWGALHSQPYHRCDSIVPNLCVFDQIIDQMTKAGYVLNKVQCDGKVIYSIATSAFIQYLPVPASASANLVMRWDYRLLALSRLVQDCIDSCKVATMVDVNYCLLLKDEVAASFETEIVLEFDGNRAIILEPYKVSILVGGQTVEIDPFFAQIDLELFNRCNPVLLTGLNFNYVVRIVLNA